MTTKNAERSNRWTAFQCPSCFGLFRIQRFNEGKKGVCPICRSVIAIPDEGVRVVPPVAEPEVMGIEAGQELLDKIAVAKPMTQEELDEAVAVAASSRERRRVYAGGAKEQLDWEEGGSEVATRGISPYLIGVVAMIGVLIAAGGIYYVQTAPSGRPGSGTTIVGDAASNRALEESMKITEGDVVNDPDVIKKVDEYAKFDLKAVDEVVKAFLESDSVDERLRWVRQPDRVKPLMLEHYEGNEIKTEGYRSFDRSQISYRGRYLTGMVRTGDFLAYPIAVIREEEEGEVKYLVDWESWTGYCEMTPEKARELKPTEPFLMRVLLRPESYFNYGFSDDTKWHAYDMRFRDSDDVFLAYTEIKSEQDEALKLVREEGGTSPYLVRVRFPRGARAGNQVEIVDVVGAGWIEDINDEKR